MQWRLILKEFGPELHYVKGKTNVVTNTLSHLHIKTPNVSDNQLHDMHFLTEHYALEDDDLPQDAFPLTYKLIT
jgi:hypothetical protein